MDQLCQAGIIRSVTLHSIKQLLILKPSPSRTRSGVLPAAQRKLSIFLQEQDKQSTGEVQQVERDLGADENQVAVLAMCLRSLVPALMPSCHCMQVARHALARARTSCGLAAPLHRLLSVFPSFNARGCHGIHGNKGCPGNSREWWLASEGQSQCSDVRL